MKKKSAILLGFALFAGCSSETQTGRDGGAADSDADADTDSDGDADSDADGDAGPDSGQHDDCSQPPATPNCQDGWCRIEPGCFILGSPITEPCRGMYSEDQVQVTLTRPFVISQHEVTQAEWEAAGFPNPAKDIDPNKPVTWVNWYEAMAYANALSEAAGLEPCYDLSACAGTVGSGCPDTPEDGVCGSGPDVFICSGEPHRFGNWYECPGYRLATSAEWEYAARAGTTTATYNGDLVTTDDNSCQVDATVEPIAWYCANSDMMLHQVCGKQPNGWGLYDMLGNASEWSDYVYTGFSLSWGEGRDGPLVDPQGADVDQSERRGLVVGWYGLEPCHLRTANKIGWLAKWRSNVGGLRLVRTAL